jgi:hypothetical protein
MTTRIILPDNATSGSVPIANSIQQAELVINTADGRLFTKNSSGQVLLLNSRGGSSNWNDLANKPDGILSSSVQFNALSNTSASFAATSSFIGGQVSGEVSASFFGDGTGIWNIQSSSFASTASLAFTASYARSSSLTTNAQPTIPSGAFGLNSWHSPMVLSATTLATVAPAINTIRFIPFVAPQSQVTQLGLAVTDGGLPSLSCSVAIYSSHPSGVMYPFERIVSTTIPAGGNLTFSSSVSLNLTPGEWYFFAHHNPHAHTFRSVEVAGQRVIGLDNTLGVNSITHFTSASLWGTSGSYAPQYPSTITSNLTLASNLALPVIALRTRI